MSEIDDRRVQFYNMVEVTQKIVRLSLDTDEAISNTREIVQMLNGLYPNFLLQLRKELDSIS